MSSRESSTSYGYGHNSSTSNVVRQGTFRSSKSRDYQGALTERESADGRRSVTTYNHNARGYDAAAPSPN
ncbi:hypothetical protein F4825DRAFT_454105 [Nemania diffusa]|nr:hypothetical protein F4825DRAFT_454105 [Nemania diffusa]